MLGWNLQCVDPQRDPHHAVDWHKHQDDAWTLRSWEHASQAKNHPTLVLAQDFDGREQVDRYYGDRNGRWAQQALHINL
jgi:hypothetical protein